jgi:hypothetical protein
MCTFNEMGVQIQLNLQIGKQEIFSLAKEFQSERMVKVKAEMDSIKRIVANYIAELYQQIIITLSLRV